MDDKNSLGNSARTPLVLDVDGTLLLSDLLYETFWAAIGRNIWRTMWLCLFGWPSPAKLKRDLLEVAGPEIELLPIHQEILDFGLSAQKSGRQVHLASGSDQSLVDALASFLGFEGDHFGSHPGRNLTGSAKAGLLADRFGKGEFDYAGNSWDDLGVWKASRRIIAVSPGPALSKRLAALAKPVKVVPGGWEWRDLLREMRPHQWVKNVLLLLPLLAAHRLELVPILTVAFAMVAFSFAASSIYIVNDLLDLDADRRHPQKRNRPIASGRLPIRTSMLASCCLAVVALAIAYVISPTVFGMTFGYMSATLVYSLWLKHFRWLDVVTLAFLFLMRVLTGAAASQVEISGWLLGVVFYVFLALAIAKRFTGLSRAFHGGHLPGRGYDQNDLRPLRYVAYTSVLAAATLVLIYAGSDEAGALYASTYILGLLVIPLVSWLVRIIQLSELGRGDYDPVVFVAHDRPGLLLASVGVAIILLAI